MHVGRPPEGGAPHASGKVIGMPFPDQKRPRQGLFIHTVQSFYVCARQKEGRQPKLNISVIHSFCQERLAAYGRLD